MTKRHVRQIVSQCSNALDSAVNASFFAEPFMAQLSSNPENLKYTCICTRCLVYGESRSHSGLFRIARTCSLIENSPSATQSRVSSTERVYKVPYT